MARLRPGARIDAARTELALRSRQLAGRFPATNAGVSFVPVNLHDEMVGDVRLVLLLQGAVVLVLAIAAANVAGLLLARAASRREEIALRGALGAGRARIVRQLATEALLLAVFAGGLGMAVASAAIELFIAARRVELESLGLIDAIRLDGIVLAFAAAMTVAAAALSGLLPAVRAADDGLANRLQNAARGQAALLGGQRVRSGLVVGQLALTVVLLYSAGLLLNSFVRLTSVDPGFRTDEVFSFYVDLPAAAYPSGERARTFFDTLFDRIAAHPGVHSVAAINRLPIGSGGRFLSRFRIEGGATVGTEEPAIGARIITPDYFRTLDVPVLRGRAITAQDQPGGLPVVVINEAAVRQFFAGDDPLGRRLVEWGYDPLEQAADAFTIVGVVANVRSRGLREPPFAEAYFALAQVPLRTMFVVVRSSSDPVTEMKAISREMHSLDRNVPTQTFRTLDQVVADSVARPRVVATILGLFSAVALIIAAVGIFGILSFAVTRRTREMGVRIALGASPRLLVRRVVRDAFLLVMIGLGMGCAGAFTFARTLQSELFELQPIDLATLAGVVVALVAVALFASVVPAWRAANVDPLIALRTE